MKPVTSGNFNLYSSDLLPSPSATTTLNEPPFWLVCLIAGSMFVGLIGSLTFLLAMEAGIRLWDYLLDWRGLLTAVAWGIPVGWAAERMRKRLWNGRQCLKMKQIDPAIDCTGYGIRNK